MSKDSMKVSTEGKTLTIERLFDAPRELIFKCWSDCEHLKHWWGPKEWPMHECELTFEEGGEWKYCLRGPNEGDESWGKAIYEEISQPEKIVYMDYFADKDGNINKEMPGMHITVEFHEENGKTRQVSTTVFDSAEACKTVVEMGVVEGMKSTYARLDDYLAEI